MIIINQTYSIKLGMEDVYKAHEKSEKRRNTSNNFMDINV